MPLDNNGMLNGGTMAEAEIISQKTNGGGDGSVWKSVFENAGGWFTGIASVVNAAKGNTPQQNQQNQPPFIPQVRNNAWMWIGLGLLACLVAYMFIKKGK